MALAALKERLRDRGHREGVVAKTIEEQTAKIPSDVFLWSAFAAMAASALFQVQGNRSRSLFVGQWAPALLLMGVYNKLVKVGGSDKESESAIGM